MVTLDATLATLWEQGNRHFGASIISRLVDVDIDGALDLLMLAARAKVVRLQYELGCPECGSTNQVINSPTELEVVEQQCSQCFHAFIPSSMDVWVTFEIVTEPCSTPGTLKKKDQ